VEEGGLYHDRQVRKNRLNWPVFWVPKVGSDCRLLLYGARGRLVRTI